jgi:hypothetical protein
MSYTFQGGSVLEETGWGCDHRDEAVILLTLPPEERKKIKARRKARRESLARALEVRANWSREEHAAEEKRLREEIENWRRHDRAA